MSDHAQQEADRSTLRHGLWRLTVLMLWLGAVTMPLALVLGVTALVWNWGNADLFGYPIKTTWEFILYAVAYGAGAVICLSYVLVWRKRAGRPEVRRAYMTLLWLGLPLAFTWTQAYYYGDLLGGAPVNRVTLRFVDGEAGRPLKQVELRRAWQPMRLETNEGTMEVVAFGHWPSTVSVRRKGYRPASVQVDQDTARRVDVVLEPISGSATAGG